MIKTEHPLLDKKLANNKHLKEICSSMMESNLHIPICNLFFSFLTFTHIGLITVQTIMQNDWTQEHRTA